MSLIIPKKEILYAPMLGTLGGGSARGFGRGGGEIPTGEAVFTTVANADGSSNGITWSIPEGVKTISFVTVGGGGGRYSSGGGGGALSYKNNIDVSSISSILVYVGQSGGYNSVGGQSYVRVNGVNYAISNGGHKGVCAGCGTPNGYTRATFSNADGGGEGGLGGSGGSGAGGGAGGYSGNGGNVNSAGAGGGGGGGYQGGYGSGGGVGLYGEGASGAAGTSSSSEGKGGSGGSDGAVYPAYGSGPGANNGNYQGQNGTGNGAVRIVWGKNRSFPSTNVDLASSNNNVTTY